MKLSIIIVNYNVEHFLEQCLISVYNAIKKLDSEVIIVDNNSIDNSVNMIKEKFPEVVLIENKENTGFSKANNQGINISKGEYVLLLNPDTVVEEDTFEKVVQYMDNNTKCGGLGVKMVDGKGQFLPESKRGLPTPAVAFYKIFGLSTLFPKNKIFGGYHLSYLDKNKNHKVDILSGAFMLMRKEALDKVGLLDETFFMYGEDIDLSYRITLGGYYNYYFADTKIIHYKGESTKKSSVNYVFVFYRAMIIFANKHFSNKNAKLFSYAINSAIYFRAFLALLKRLISKSILPIIDTGIIISLLFLVKNIYSKHSGITYEPSLYYWAFPFYTCIWIISAYFSGAYEKDVKIKSAFKTSFWGTLIILAIYSLLPETIRFSRFIILIGGGITLIYFILSRLIVKMVQLKSVNPFKSTNRIFGIVGTADEIIRIESIINRSFEGNNSIYYILPNFNGKEKGFIGNLSQIDQLIDNQGINELVFSAKNLSSQDIIKLMTTINHRKVDFKIAQPETAFLIGSNSTHTSGDMYLLDLFNISKPENLRKKRAFDILISIILIPLSIILVFINKKPIKAIFNLFLVLLGFKTWVGFTNSYSKDSLRLPKIKPSVLSPLSNSTIPPSQEAIDRSNMIYAKNYSLIIDFNIIRKNLNRLYL